MPGSGSGPTLSPAFEAEAAKLPARVAAFLANPATPKVLKQTYELMHMKARIDLVADMIDTGDLDAHMQCTANAMGGFLAQLASVPREQLKPHLDDILAALDARNLPLKTLVIPTYYNGSTTTSRIDGFQDQSISERPLVQWATESLSLKPLDIAQTAPSLLAQAYRSGETTQPLVHHYLLNPNRSVRDLEVLAETASSLAFLDAVDADGKTVFYRLATENHNQHHLDLMSWMLMRRPELVHATDALGWTVLDRYVLRNNSPDDTRARFLMAAGARFHWQTPPGLSHAEAIAFRDKHDRLRRAGPPQPKPLVP